MTQQRNKVRIIGGAHRRRLLPFPDASGLRPTPDRVRETVFNWLGQTLDGKRCLDLFAGSGAMGFEAASRGAAGVDMVEKSRDVAAALSANRQLLAAQNVQVHCRDALQFLRASSAAYDVVFLDPPYDSDLLATVLPQLAAHLAPSACVYIESRTWPALADWTVLRRDRAGAVNFGLITLAVVE